MEETRSKIALITGSSRGLGKDMALSLAKNGTDIVLTYRSKKEEAEIVAAPVKQKKLERILF
jgi:NAD(P)-dependent dehydrogenase (short-subunit alcohol dehydrogenase family)